MNLVELAEKYNRLIRKNDKLTVTKSSSSREPAPSFHGGFFSKVRKESDDWLQPLNLCAHFDAESLAEDMELYKEERYQAQLGRLLSKYQQAIDSTGFISLEDLSSLAKKIVNGQKFCDGNHRTALLLCYHLELYVNGQLLRIKPYLLYAAIDFEYLKSMHNLSEPTGRFFSSNAIATALRSRAIAEVYSPDIKAAHLDRIISALIDMPLLLATFSKPKAVSSCGGSLTTRRKLFCQFLGDRPTPHHSASLDLGAYLEFLAQNNLIDSDFNPCLDLPYPR